MGWPTTPPASPGSLRPAGRRPGRSPRFPTTRSWTATWLEEAAEAGRSRRSRARETRIAAIFTGVVLLGGVILGWLAGSWATPLGFISMCGGILVLFTRLPRDRDAGPDNGARV